MSSLPLPMTLKIGSYYVRETAFNMSHVAVVTLFGARGYNTYQAATAVGLLGYT